MARSFPYSQLAFILAFCLLGVGQSDFASDRAECATQLAGLATCLPFMEEKAKVPTPDCCSGLKQLVDKSKKCLCVLVKNRNDPQLGFKVNISLALTLPKTCSVPVNGSECIDILHIPPNSTDAQIFKQIASGGPTNGNSSNSSSGGSTADVNHGKSDAGRKSWLVTEMAFVVWIWCLVSLVILGR
ncbi:non-specific lipid transfer protein GPI-anchored 14-like [Magnolia sinica]|uniref:non-specific lipid transfer protein GPI-anchored 14-like n=1 Tax=Magnolia sinica TaxID=86752 RepID=UPI00265A763E|nr:non-specific lipid transfer protein GPI-anchored 14-like [Magnolia sinica]